MKKLIPLFVILAAGIASAEWRLNPYTQRQDYYEAKAGIAASTGTLTVGLAAEIARAMAAEAAIAVDTGTLTTGLATEISNRQIADLAIGVTTGTLRADLNSEISRATIREDAIGASTGTIYAALNSTASALTAETASRIARDLELIPSTATGTYPHSIAGAASLNVLKAGDTMTGPLTLSGSSLTVTGGSIEYRNGYFLRSRRNTGNTLINLLGFTGDVLYTTLATASSGVNGWIIRNSGDNPLVTINGDGDTALTGDSFSVGGSTLVVAGGKVGVGTASPAVNLAVATADASYAKIHTQNSHSGYTATDGFQMSYGEGDGYLANFENGGIKFFTNATQKMTILAGGNVGIGTTAPASKLHVQDGVVLSSTTSGFGAFTGYGSSGGCLMFRDTDNAGWTECKFLDGTMSCATDADGVCD